ncbi:MAG: 6-phosphogluconolactonase [Rhodobacteraceae bacterium]|jgi:6-phosphogluconolactonase|uniref:6-phosphogluconolactonase n=1 Tax=Salipiger profundus TaxID=1229727 RepID=A0A1U7DAC2_9RHOB|nr:MULTISPECIES: 6-phosphogluconolactonase [Salipiger]APX25058.1 6-phosphogluconolactonase [Salipiger profundus]MAB07565.1 6-phosphogluconolactonase [Paracoccaceae bacterium]GGA15096.1 6-phosphogluconolactonase [Salipiger profundus]SFD11760.1 6-phosphogluconolactonase [Salipiger profundus]
MNYDFRDYPDREMLAMDLANQIAGELRAALAHQERAAIAVPGGTSPGPVFDALCAADLDWSRVDVMLTDERWVPETSERSNTRLLRERLLTDRAAAARFLPLYAEAEAPEGKLEELAADIEPALPLAVVLLGMGADMHTASIFPGADKLEEALAPNAPILLPMRAPGAQEPRITLSAHVLDGALKKHVLVYGSEKRDVLHKAQGLPTSEAPVNAILDGAVVHWAE